MSIWSLKYTKKITEENALFIVKRFPTIITFEINNLYSAIVEINSIKDYSGPNICVVHTNAGWYLMVKCDTEERCDTVYNKIVAMFLHFKDIENTMIKIKQLG